MPRRLPATSAPLPTPRRRSPSPLRQRIERLMQTPVELVPHASFLHIDPWALLDETQASFDQARRAQPASDAAMKLLTSGEEAELFRRLNLFRFHARRLIDGLSMRSAPSRVEQIERLLAGAEAIRNHLVQVNVRLVSFVARNFASRHFPLGDLLSEGYWTLLRSIERFDFSKGFRFSTYATWALRFNFNRAVAEQRRKRNRMLHLDDCEGDSERSTESAPLAESQYPRLKRQVETLLAGLDPRERAIVEARFGMTPAHDGETLKSIARRMGVCKERVRQLELRALGKLRQAALRAGISLDAFEL